MKLFGLKGMKTAIGIDLNGMRLVLFCFIGCILLIIRPTISKLFKIYYLFLLYSFLSLYYSIDFLEGIRFFSKLLVPFLIYWTTKIVSCQKLEKINRWIMYVVFLHSLFSIPTLLRWLKLDIGVSDIPRASGLCGGRVIFGTFMVFIFILFYYRKLILQKKNTKENLFIILLALIGVILSGTRIAWIGLVISMITMGMAKRVRGIMIGGVVIGGLIILMLIFFKPLFKQRIGMQFIEGKFIYTGSGGGTVYHRVLVWKWLFKEKIYSHFLNGYGLGSSKKILSELP
ncbi:MAG: hypothetical protein ACTSQG_10385, partial [Promethearchaeota archaeon]